MGPVYEYKQYIVWIQEARVAPWTVHVRNYFIVGISAIGMFLSLKYPADVIDSPSFYPNASWLERCLRMCLYIPLFRFRFVCI